MGSVSPANKRTPRAMWAIRGFSIALAVIIVLAFGTVFYSAYVDYRGISDDVSNPAYHSVVRTMDGDSESVAVNLTVPNHGLYTLQVSVSCPEPNVEAGVSCEQSSVTVPAGQTRTLEFRITVADLSKFENSLSQQINGSVSIEIMPFASVSLSYDLGGLVEAASQS